MPCQICHQIIYILQPKPIDSLPLNANQEHVRPITKSFPFVQHKTNLVKKKKHCKGNSKKQTICRYKVTNHEKCLTQWHHRIFFSYNMLKKKRAPENA